jgi:hypothetical protein
MRLAEGSTVVGVCRAEKEEEAPDETEGIPEGEAAKIPADGGNETAQSPEPEAGPAEENP